MRTPVIALSGGGIATLAELGFLFALEEAGIPFGPIIGTSGGSTIGAALAEGARRARFNPALRPLKWVYDILDATNFLSLKDKSFSPFDMAQYKGEALSAWLRSFLGDTTFGELARANVQFACTSTDMESDVLYVMSTCPRPDTRLPGLTVSYPDCSDIALWQAVRASSTIPAVFQPINLPVGRRGDMRTLWDGGIVANVPVAEAATLWPDNPIIACDMAGQPAPPPPAWQIARRYVWLLFQVQGKSMARHRADAMRIASLTKRAGEVWINPDRLGVKATEFDLSHERRIQLIEAGKAATEHMMPSIMRIVQEEREVAPGLGV